MEINRKFASFTIGVVMREKPNLLVLASGEKEEGKGGSGFEYLVQAQQSGALCANIVGVVSNHPNGGVFTRARKLGVKFHYFIPPNPNKPDGVAESIRAHREIMRAFKAEFVALSGCLWRVLGLNPAKTINIHPGPLPRFGGKGMYGHHVHEAVLAAYHNGQIDHSAVCMHFVDAEYDNGPVFFYHRVPILSTDTPEELGHRVNDAEHEFQFMITNKVVRGEIFWDGKNRSSLWVPPGYPHLPKGEMTP